MAIPKKRRRSGRPAARGAEPPPAQRPPRSDILERAADLIGKRGFVGMSAQDIADELQFSKANFFYHVRSKEELLYEIFVENLNYAIRHLEAIIARPDAPPERLRALMEFYVRLNTERAAIMLVWYKEKEHLTAAHQAVINELENRIATILNKFYRSGVKSGHFQQIDSRIARVAIFGMAFALTRWPRLREEFTHEELVRQIQKVACEGLLRPVARRAR
jgi:TetR/AcrR family transcriptional regulator, cholesterol catabolism regulator